MSRHTPGPWSVSKNMQGVFGASHGNGLEPIGYVYRPAVAEHSEVVRRANADVRLISAAPELLDALRIAVRQNSHDMQMTGEEIRICEAAIEKATGESA